MNSFANWQISAGTHSCAALAQVNTLTVNIGSRMFEKEANPYFLLEAITREATPNSVICVFKFRGHRCVVWHARLPRCYSGIGNEA
jgi:hypothetical protein